MKTLLPLILLLSGCGFSYQFDPRAKVDNKEELKSVAEQVSKVLQEIDKRLKVLEGQNEKNSVKPTPK